MSRKNDGYRLPTAWERHVLLKLVDPEFPGCVVLRQQIDHILVSPIDKNGSLDLKCEDGTVAPVHKRIPTEAQAVDRDGTTIHYLLHVVGGKVNELEVFKDDSSPVLEHPSAEEIAVLILGPD